MHKISPLIGSLRATPPIIGSEEERARREYTIQMSKRALIDLCQQEASKLLVQGRYDLAIPGAIQVKILHLMMVSSSPGIPIRNSNLIFVLATGSCSFDANSARKHEYQASIAAGGYYDQRDNHRPCILGLCMPGAGSYFLKGDIR